MDGNALSFANRGQDGQGAGWTAANSVFWQCTASKVVCFQPPTAQTGPLVPGRSFLEMVIGACQTNTFSREVCTMRN
ncbi:MAG: hypothetical protein R2822_21290 [Spirosomataceae bacterium]